SAEQNMDTDVSASAEIQTKQTFKNAYTRLYIGGYFTVRPVFQTWQPHKWHVRKWNDGTVELSQGDWTGSRYALDDSSHGFRTYPRNFSKHQSWWVIKHSDGTISFKNQKTKRCIDSSHKYGIRTWPCNYSSYQRFY